jgi:hypothetical protein
MDYATIDRRALVRFGFVDLLGILAMVWVGELRHGNDPLASPFLYLDTLAPFLVGWVVAAYALGAYGPRVLEDARLAIGSALVAWFVGNAIGQALRASSLFHGGTELAFFLVMFGFVGAALSVGRGVVIAVRGD